MYPIFLCSVYNNLNLYLGYEYRLFTHNPIAVIKTIKRSRLFSRWKLIRLQGLLKDWSIILIITRRLFNFLLKNNNGRNEYLNIYINRILQLKHIIRRNNLPCRDWISAGWDWTSGLINRKRATYCSTNAKTISLR